MTNPGLSHLAIEIFEYLDTKSLLNSRLVCKLWDNFIEEELLCLTKMKYWKNQASWKTDSFFYLGFLSFKSMESKNGTVQFFMI